MTVEDLLEKQTEELERQKSLEEPDSVLHRRRLRLLRRRWPAHRHRG